MLKADYLSLRRRFEPVNVKLVIVAESPPVSGKYFYNAEGAVTEPLFKAMMKQIGSEPRTKIDGLIAFQGQGWALVDATYEPVNAYNDRKRDDVIARDYPDLCDDLKRLLAERWTQVPLILLKANVCRALEPKLTNDNFAVLNKGRRIYFPSHGRQNDFARQFGEIIQTCMAD